MKKTFFILTLALALSACTPAPAVSTPPAQTRDTTTYRNDTYGLSFEYPKAWSLVEVGGPYNEFVDTTKGEDPFVRLQLPQETYPGTNFGNADLGLSYVYVASLEDCLAYPSTNGSVTFDVGQSIEINGITYYTSESSGAAAGNRYDSKLFRTYQNDYCFSAAETLHTTNIGNYDPGTVTAVDEDAVWGRFDAILQTMSFTPPVDLYSQP